MPKKPCFRTLFNSQHFKESQTFLKSALQDDEFFSSLLGKLSWYMPLLMKCELLGLFVNRLVANDKYILRNRENLP